jgi:hypothetical protein
VQGEDTVRLLSFGFSVARPGRVDPRVIENRDTLRKVLNLPPSTIMEYKTNNGACPFPFFR